MNYRHHFHAGNFADLLKHAMLLGVLERATRKGAPAFDLVETHAGAGVYALDTLGGRRSAEAQAGLDRLLAAEAKLPPLLDRLVERVRSFNGDGPVVRYPGSPLLGLGRLRPGDRYIGCELHPQDHATLVDAVRRWPPRVGVDVRIFCVDGYAQVATWSTDRPRVVLIDPPYERGDELQRIVGLVDTLGRATPAAMVVLWAPLKDLESLDRLRAGVEAVARAPGWIVEARLRSLDDPLAMNGCALIGLGMSELAADASSVATWIAKNLGRDDAAVRLRTLDVAPRNLHVDQGFVSASRERKADVRKAREPSAPKPRRR